ncbi:MAG: alpha/beta fold hydrolase [Rhodothermales bacterium]|nr:alpha/beta fold hydrolase [Rhodothermales bacterium]
METIPFPLHEAHGYRYVDEGPATARPPVVLLHGMLGDVGNWISTIRALSENGYRVLVPVLPVYAMPMKETHVPGLVAYVRGFITAMGLAPMVLSGNSLGGHVALLYTLHHPGDVAALILSGSSGIYEVEMGTVTLRRRDRDFLRERAALTFYDPAHVTDELLEDAYRIVNDRGKALRLIRMARSAQQETVTERLPEIEAPTLLVWGRNDKITPPDVAEEFESRMPHAELVFIDRCGHAPMIEHPNDFNALTLAFLRKIIGTPALADAS